ncbi:MAG: DUF192 domain-containing protein [Candidatus Absconditabacterales bacterium]|nr:DUF192 domain-containing protein [Candidatus Absconditabacterales bacterium]
MQFEKKKLYLSNGNLFIPSSLMRYFLCFVIVFLMHGCVSHHTDPLVTSHITHTLPRELCSGNRCFLLRYATTPQEREQGLMNVSYLPPNEGMLFDFGEPQITFFWMKNTLIPLDIIRLDDEWTIVGTWLNAQPCPSDTIQCPSQGPGIASRYVLEINAGLIDELGLTGGSRFVPRY